MTTEQKKTGHNFWHGYSYESYKYPCQKSYPWIFTFSIWIYNENHCHLLILVKWKEPGNHFYQGYSYHHMSIHAKNHFPDSFNLVRISKIIVCNAEFIQWLWTNKKSLGPDFLILDTHMGYNKINNKILYSYIRLCTILFTIIYNIVCYTSIYIYTYYFYKIHIILPNLFYKIYSSL